MALDWFTDRSRSEGRVESILSILDFTDPVLKLDVEAFLLVVKNIVFHLHAVLLITSLLKP